MTTLQLLRAHDCRRAIKTVTVLAAATLFMSSGCGKGRGRAQEEKPSATYTVKGVVKMLPPAAKPGNDKTVVVLHQSIEKFRDREGQEVGMMAMPMPFTLANGVDMKDITVGSKVEFTFGVFWEAPTPTRILQINKLPDDTQINFTGE